MAENNPSGKISVGSMESASGILKREGGFLYVAGVLQRSGVFNGGLKTYESFEESIPSMAGAVLIRGEHPKDPVTGEFVPHSDKDDIIGTISEAVKDPENRLARGIFKLDESKLTPEEIKALEANQPIGTSPGYWCDKEVLPEPKLWTDGKPYNYIEKSGFKYDHFACPKKPACRDCGILINSLHGDDGIAKIRKPEEIREAVAKLKMETEPTFMVNQALDEVALQSEILDILECTDDEFKQGFRAKKLLVQILKTILALPEPNGLSVMSQNKSLEENMGTEGKPVIDEAGIMDKLRLMVNAEVEPIRADLAKSQATIVEQATALTAAQTELAAIKAAEEGRKDQEVAEKAVKDAEAEAGRKKNFMEKVKPGIAKTVEEAEALWAQVKADVGGWILANPEKMAFSVNSSIPHVMGEGSKYVPKGATIAPGISVNEENKDDYFRSMGITPASELGAILWPAAGGK
jgi:hypothetical protein